ncbi:MAG: hypothetical protein ABI611_11475 [Solirubrobacteraceae bacterium]
MTVVSDRLPGLPGDAQDDQGDGEADEMVDGLWVDEAAIAS